MTSDTYHLDFETTASYDLKKYGAYAYAEHKDTRILMMAIAKNDKEPLLWVYNDWLMENDEALDLLKEATKSGARIFAHNYQFEHAICKYRLKKDLGVKAPAIEQWRCTAAMCRRAAIPHALERAANFLELDMKKDKRGSQLISLFSIIRKGNRRTIESEPENTVTIGGEKITIEKAWDMFCEYCKQDVRTEREIHNAIHQFDLDHPYNVDSLKSFQFDARMNNRGIPVNIEALKKTQEQIESYQEGMVIRFQEITGGLKPTQIMKFGDWARDGGYPHDNLQAATVEKFFAGDTENVDEDTLEALKIYSLMSFAALKKIPAMMGCANKDGRVRGAHVWSGAIRTHRWTGTKVQPQNIKRPSIKDTDTAYKMLCDGADHDTVEMLWGNYLEVVASCVRHFIKHPTKDLLDIDYSNIEARILAWLAGEQWKLDLFAADVDLYIRLASIIFNVPEDQIGKKSLERFVGKTGELGCGYGTGAPKFSQMLSQFGYSTPQKQVDRFKKVKAETIAAYHFALNMNDKEKILAFAEKSVLIRSTTGLPTKKRAMKYWKNFKPITDKHIANFLQLKLARKVVDTFREQNPKAVDLWDEFDKAAIKAINTFNTWYPAKSGKAPSNTLESDTKVEGGKVFYRERSVKVPVADGKMYFAVKDVGFPALLMRLPANHTLVYPYPEVKRAKKTHVNDQGEQRTWETSEITFKGQIAGSTHWGRVTTYGARLVENACQAIGGDFLSNGVVVAEEQGYETFMIVHDQALDTVGKGKSPEGYAAALCDLPDWAKGFPLAGEGGVVPYYTKD